MNLKIFLQDNVKNYQLDGIISNLNEVTEYFNDLSSDANSFISIINNNNDVLRFSWVAEQKWLVEYPVITNQIHQQRYSNESESLELINRVDANESFNNFSGFIEVPIQEFTLDEILEFKEEDSYLLREEEPPAKKVITPKSIVSKPKKTSKPSIILGDISVPKEQPRTRSITRITARKKQSTPASPLKQFKTSAAQLKKEKKQPKTTKAPVKQVAKKANPPKSIPAKTDSTSLLNLEKTIELTKVELTKASKTSKKKTKPQQTTTSKTNPKAPEQQPTIKPKKSKGKTLQTLGEPIAEKKKVVPKKSKPFNQQTSKKDTTKPNDDGFFSI